MLRQVYGRNDAARSARPTIEKLLRGALDSTHWWLDLSGVYLPAVLMTAVATTLVRRESSGS